MESVKMIDAPENISDVAVCVASNRPCLIKAFSSTPRMRASNSPIAPKPINAIQRWSAAYLTDHTSPEIEAAVYSLDRQTATPGDFPPPPQQMNFHQFINEWNRRSKTNSIDWSLGLPANSEAARLEDRESHQLRRSSEDLRVNDIFLGNLLLSSLNSDRLIEDTRPHPAQSFGLVSDPSQYVESSGRLWIGDAGHISHLHFDAHDGFLCPILGVKRVWLYEPKEHIDLIPLKPNSNAAALNPLHYETDVALRQKYPKFATAKPILVEVSPGDVLFIPVYWWHFVFSVSPTIAVNYWMYPSLSASRLKFNERLLSVTNVLLRRLVQQKLASRETSRYSLFTDENVRSLYQSLLRGPEGNSEEWQQLWTDASYEIRSMIRNMLDSDEI